MGIFLYRSLGILQGTPITHWPRGAVHDDDSALARRISDAHANCLENLPVFAVLVLVAATQGTRVRHQIPFSPVFDPSPLMKSST
jgi:uncharacterized MAPEG superfamily protein